MKNMDFPFLLKNKQNELRNIYLDNASTTQIHQSVIDAMQSYYVNGATSIRRGIYERAELITCEYEVVRQKVASFLHADISEIIFTSGATEGINFIASTWGRLHIKQGDEIVITALEHHANIIPWQQLAISVGAVLKIIPIDDNGLINYQTIDQYITCKTRLVACTWISNAIGVYVDIEKIIIMAKSVGARILIDGAQAVGFFPVNLINLDIDFFVFSAHKIYGPTGLGVLFIKQSVQCEVPPFKYGGGAIFSVDYKKTIFSNSPHCYEPGTPPIAAVFGFGASLDYIKSIGGVSVIHRHTSFLMKYCIDRLLLIDGIKIIGDINSIILSGHIISFIIDSIHAHDVAAYLSHIGIAVRAGNHCAQPLAQRLGYDASVRISLALYNTHDDITFCTESLRNLLYI